MKKERLDILVQRQAGVTPSEAQGLIRTGNVYDENGTRLDKPAMRLDQATALDVREGPRFVSRGGEKLEAAFDAFALDVAGAIAIDVGASTGGFTHCLLEHGAARVYAVDVGYGQLAWTLRQDPRVIVMERTNIRHLTPDQLPERPSFFTADCSFISLRVVLPPLRALCTENAQGIVLIKPQFEAESDEVSKGGVVHDEAVRERAVEEVLRSARTLGFHENTVIPSPLKGPAGNTEFLAHLRCTHHA